MGKAGSYLLAKSLRANLAVLLFMLLPLPVPGTAIAAVIIGLITLEGGVAAGLVALAWSAIPAIAASLKWQLLATHYNLSFMVAALTWLAAVLFRQQPNWQRTTERLVLVGLVWVVTLFLLPAKLLAILSGLLEQTIVNALKQTASLNVAAIGGVLHDKASFLMGALYFAICFIAVIYLMLARAWQLRIKQPAKRWTEFYHIRASRWMSLLSASLIGAAFIWQNNWLQAAAFIAVIPFLLSGFSLVIYCCLQNRERKILHIAMLVVAASLLLLFPGIGLALLALSGFADVWIKFRNLTWLHRNDRSDIQPKRTSS